MQRQMTQSRTIPPINCSAAATASALWFGLISVKMAMPRMIKQRAFEFITDGVGPTTNRIFSQSFMTQVTPAHFMFLVWPGIALLQLAVVGASAVRAVADRDSEPMTRDQLTALTFVSNPDPPAPFPTFAPFLSLTHA